MMGMTMRWNACRSLVPPSLLHWRRFHNKTVQNALDEVRARLRARGIDGSDAKTLVAHALEPQLLSSNDVFFHMQHELIHAEAEKLTAMVERRECGEPLAYVVGVKEFWSMEFRVTKDTLIPRSDSEVLVEALTSQYDPQTPLRILDLGTGSGCLLLAALSEYANASGVGIDISSGALAVARQNAEALGLNTRSTFLEVDMESLPLMKEHNPTPSALRDLLMLQFDVIMCNPPYIPVSELPLIAPDVLAHEPHGALFSDGPDAVTKRNQTVHTDEDLGLRFYAALASSVDFLLDSVSPHNSSVLLEIGSQRQAEAVRDLFAHTTVTFDRFLMDAEHRYRGVVLRRYKQ